MWTVVQQHDNYCFLAFIQLSSWPGSMKFPLSIPCSRILPNIVMHFKLRTSWYRCKKEVICACVVILVSSRQPRRWVFLTFQEPRPVWYTARALDNSRQFFIEELTKDTPYLAREGEVWGVVRECSLAWVLPLHFCAVRVIVLYKTAIYREFLIITQPVDAQVCDGTRPSTGDQCWLWLRSYAYNFPNYLWLPMVSTAFPVTWGPFY